MLWRIFLYTIVAIPTVYMNWAASLFMFVDLYGIPATKPCDIPTHSTKRERRRTTNYGTGVIYYWCVLLVENILLTAFFYMLRQELVRKYEQCELID